MGATATQNGAADSAMRAITMADAAADFLTAGTTLPMIQLIKRQICRPTRRQATDEELALFISVARQKQLNPFDRQICAVFRWDRRIGDEKMSLQTTIDGFRLIAQRTREWEGYAGDPLYCDADGRWTDVWLRNDMPKAARVGVWRRGHREPARGLAHLEMFRDERSPMWAPGPKSAHMLGKCAEALAFRRAFPQEFSGLYTEDEAGAFNDAPVVDATPVGEAQVVVELPAGLVEDLRKGLDLTGWDDADLSMQLVDLGLDDASDPREKLATLAPEQAEVLKQRMADAVDGADQDRDGGDDDDA